MLSPERREPHLRTDAWRERRASVLALALPEPLSERVNRPLCLLITR
jgi:hypothetical protein